MPTALRLTDLKRDAILKAAIGEFRTHGFEATSMDQIAARAEVSKRTVYNHFASKDELFAEILMQLWDQSAAQLDLPYRSDRPLRDQLRELLEAKMGLLCDANFRDLARVAIAATIHSPARAGEMVAKLSAREEGITAWIRAAQADGRLRAGDPAFVGHQLQGLLKAFAFWPQVTMGQPPLELAMQAQVIESTLDLFLARYAL